MSVLYENDHGWIISCENYFNKIYELCKTESFSEKQVKFRDVYFDIKTPFYTDTMSKKIGQKTCSEKDFKVTFETIIISLFKTSKLYLYLKAIVSC